MIDPIGAMLLAVPTHPAAALSIAFTAGMTTSMGPCVAPRYLAIASLVNGSPRPVVPALTYICGVIAAFVVLGYAAGTIGALRPYSAWTYGMLAAGLIVAGCLTLVRATGEDDHAKHCAVTTPVPRSLGAVFLLGASSALVVSPCCTPVITTLVAATAAYGQPALGIMLLTAFALGHAVPLAVTASAAASLGRIVQRYVGGQAPAIVGGTLMLALGAYYGVIA